MGRGGGRPHGAECCGGAGEGGEGEEAAARRSAAAAAISVGLPPRPPVAALASAPVTPAALWQASTALAQGSIPTPLALAVGEEGVAPPGGGSDAALEPAIAADAAAALASSLALSPAPLPAPQAWELAWVARRVLAGFPVDEAPKAAGGAAQAAGGAAGAPPAPAAAAPATPAGPRTTLIRMPKAAINAEAVAMTGRVGVAFASDALQRRRAARLAAIEAEVVLAESAAAAGTRKASVDTRWWRYTYSAAADYREGGAHSLFHQRLLEAAAAQDLGAVWSLWSEASGVGAMAGAPDLLGLEITMDAAARAGRADLVFGALWPQMMQLRIQPTPAMYLLMLKAAALAQPAEMLAEEEGGVAAEAAREAAREAHARAYLSLAEGMLQVCLRRGVAVDARHFHAVMLCALTAGQPRRAYEVFNAMKRRGIGATPAVFLTLLGEAAAAGRAEDCHYIWRTLERSHAIAVPPALYDLLIRTFAAQGALADMEAARARMTRRADGRQAPVPTSLMAMLEAYAAAGDVAKARGVAE